MHMAIVTNRVATWEQDTDVNAGSIDFKLQYLGFFNFDVVTVFSIFKILY